jgi:protein-L-isoaspartate(D-aspartate) O-methyltransferase
MDYAAARRNMIESQLRPWEILDPRVLELLARLPREDFVPESYRQLAYADMMLPLGRGQVMMPPKLEARFLQELEIEPEDKILEVGTGSGWMTALLANLGAHVYSVEIIPEFKLRAEAKLAAHGIRNVTLEIGDAARGWTRHAPYDVICITGSLPVLPEDFPRSLAPGGRLMAVVGRSPVMEAVLVRRLDEENWNELPLFETELPPLMNAPEPSRFVF